MKNRKIFPEIHDSHVREELTERILSIACPIPTIHTLIQDLRLLNPLSKKMLELQKLLVISESEAWIDSCTIKDIFIKREIEMRGENSQSTIESQYLELWLFLMRNFAALSGEKPRSGHKKTNKIMPMECKYRWAEFVDCARLMGYILKEAAIPPLADLIAGEIRETLDRARKYAQDSKISEFVNSIQDTTSHLGVENPRPSFVGNTNIKKFLRSGLPSKHACEVASKLLFLPNIKVDKLAQEEGYNINEFCILHFFFINFFCPYSPFSARNPAIPQNYPHFGPSSEADDAVPDNTANTATSSDRATNEPPLSDVAVNPSAENHPPPATPLGERLTRMGHENSDENSDENSSEEDILLVLGLFEDGSGYFQTGFRLLFKVYNEKRNNFFREIQFQLERPESSIRFLTRHKKSVPAEQLCIQKAHVSDNILFGVIKFPPNAQPIRHYNPVDEENIIDLVLALISPHEDDLIPPDPNINSLVKWIKDNQTKLGTLQSISWFNKGKRKFPNSKEPEGSRQRRLREYYTYQGSNRQHIFENVDEHGEIIQ
jgi:hypothetical protein